MKPRAKLAGLLKPNLHLKRNFCASISTKKVRNDMFDKLFKMPCQYKRRLCDSKIFDNCSSQT